MPVFGINCHAFPSWAQELTKMQTKCKFFPGLNTCTFARLCRMAGTCISSAQSHRSFKLPQNRNPAVQCDSICACWESSQALSHWHGMWPPNLSAPLDTHQDPSTPRSGTASLVPARPLSAPLISTIWMGTPGSYSLLWFPVASRYSFSHQTQQQLFLRQQTPPRQPAPTQVT